MAVAHRFPFTPAIRRLRELLELGDLGELYYLDVVCHHSDGLGSERNVLWGLGVEQVSLIAYLLGDEPVEVRAAGESYAEPGIFDVANCSLKFATGIASHIHLSWLGLERTFRLTAIGAEQTVVIDDNSHELGLRIYLKGGDILAPKIPAGEPLRLACESFLKTVRSRRSSSPAAMREAWTVVGVLEALQISLECGGSAEKVGTRRDANVVPLRPR